VCEELVGRAADLRGGPAAGPRTAAPGHTHHAASSVRANRKMNGEVSESVKPSACQHGGGASTASDGLEIGPPRAAVAERIAICDAFLRGLERIG